MGFAFSSFYRRADYLGFRQAAAAALDGGVLSGSRRARAGSRCFARAGGRGFDRQPAASKMERNRWKREIQEGRVKGPRQKEPELAARCLI